MPGSFHFKLWNQKIWRIEQLLAQKYPLHQNGEERTIVSGKKPDKFAAVIIYVIGGYINWNNQASKQARNQSSICFHVIWNLTFQSLSFLPLKYKEYKACLQIRSCVGNLLRDTRQQLNWGFSVAKKVFFSWWAICLCNPPFETQ